MKSFRQIILTLLFLATSLFTSGEELGAATLPAWQVPQDAPATKQEPTGDPPVTVSNQREGILVQVRLPVTGEVSTQLKQVMARHLETAPLTDDPKDRPVMVLEFDTSNSRNGRGSEFEACLSLARFITSSQMNRVETVAYIPGPKGLLEDADIDTKLKSELIGHPVLIALACNHIVMHVDASLGQAGIDEEFVDSLIVMAYQDIAGKRLTLPKEVAVALVDPGSSLYRVDLGEGNYVLADGQTRQRLENEGKVNGYDTITEAGSLPYFGSGQLMDYQLIHQRTTARNDIARKFGLRPNSLEGDPTLGKQWSGLQIQLDRSIDTKTVSWIIKALEQKWTDDSNLVIVHLDAVEVDVYEAIRLARHLASYDSNEVRTIAYVPNEAKGAVGLIALSCDHLVMAPKATIGGGSVEITKEQVAEAMGSVRELAEQKHRDWSLFAAMLDPKTSLFLYRHKDSTQIRILSPEEHEMLDDKDAWQPLSELDVANGISGETAEKYFISRYLADDYQDLKTFYQLKEDPEILQPTMTDKWIDSLAGFLASPMIAFWLLFGAMFFISSEMSQPGVGVPGFIGAILLMLFFWSQFLDGNADWLEILLFVAGVACILLEIFVIPGLGVFGFGGLLMIVVSIILATQSFVIPRNSEEFSRLPVSMMMVIGAAMGSIAAMVVFRKFLPNMPVLKRLMLSPPGNDDAAIQLHEREAIVNWAHLQGKRGETITPLLPAGKARFGDNVVDVISDGRMIEKNCPISVETVNGNVIRVAPIE